MSGSPTLGTLLRHLIESLDSAVDQAYARAGLDYKARYTPIIRALCALGPATIRAISVQAGITHSAASQTLSQMAQRGLVSAEPGEDARERIIALTPAAQAMLPALERQWAATEAAARGLDEELGLSLPDVLLRTLQLLERRSFSERIEDAASSRKPPRMKGKP